MKRLIPTLAVALAGLLASAPAHAQFGLNNLADGSTATQAGSHPYAMSTYLAFNTVELGGEPIPDGELRDLTVSAPPGLLVDRDATARCTAAEFRPPGGGEPHCAPQSAVGRVNVELGTQGFFFPALVYNLIPPPGAIARLGFEGNGLPVVVDLGLSQSPPTTASPAFPTPPRSSPSTPPSSPSGASPPTPATTPSAAAPYRVFPAPSSPCPPPAPVRCRPPSR
jgi:hypothetical protein